MVKMFVTNLVMIEQILLKNLLESNRKSTKKHVFQKMKINGPQTVTKLCCSPRLVFQTRFAIFAKIWLKSIRSDCFLSQLCRYLPLKLIACSVLFAESSSFMYNSLAAKSFLGHIFGQYFCWSQLRKIV